MRSTAFAFAALGVLIAGPSHGACTRPETPSCAIEKGPFPRGADYDACRHLMIAYKGGMERFASCLKDDGQSEAERQSVDELESALSQFNRRARGE
jgi:hypothetical protein